MFDLCQYMDFSFAFKWVESLMASLTRTFFVCIYSRFTLLKWIDCFWSRCFSSVFWVFMSFGKLFAFVWQWLTYGNFRLLSLFYEICSYFRQNVWKLIRDNREVRWKSFKNDNLILINRNFERGKGQKLNWNILISWQLSIIDQIWLN